MLLGLLFPLRSSPQAPILSPYSALGTWPAQTLLWQAPCPATAIRNETASGQSLHLPKRRFTAALAGAIFAPVAACSAPAGMPLSPTVGDAAARKRLTA